jgi:endonuclease/exonuclease/phosphatase family metal-dependent hydrolase
MLLLSLFILVSLSLLIVKETSLEQSKVKMDVTEPIKVVTFNIRYGRGLDGSVNINKTIEKLKVLDTDIIAIQEIEKYSLRSGGIDQTRLVANALGMNAFFYPALSFPGFQYGNAIFSRFPIEHVDIVNLHSNLENRLLLISKINIRNDVFIYVLNTHLGLNKKEREAHLHIINDVLQSLEGPVILAGDLNSTPADNEYEILSDRLTKSNKGYEIKTFHENDWQIDYIFYSPHFLVLDTVAYESQVSDHYPVKATFQLK